MYFNKYGENSLLLPGLQPICSPPWKQCHQFLITPSRDYSMHSKVNIYTTHECIIFSFLKAQIVAYYKHFHAFFPT